MYLDWREVAKTANSSYQENELGEFIYGYVRAAKPTLAVEMGVLHGYSTLHIAAALRDNDNGILYAFDRWPGHIPNCEADVRHRLKVSGLDNWVALETRDVFRSPPAFSEPIDLLYVDLENTYNTLSWTFDKFAPRMAVNGTMMFEGGTVERDALEWVKRHDNNGGLGPFLVEMGRAYTYFTVQSFPGVTVVQPRWGQW